MGDYVPFYFCPRSVMLYLLYRGNHPELTYTDGQRPIVHLEADLMDVIAWANSQGKRWAFTLSNASAAYAQFRANLSEIDQINWEAVAANDWRASAIKEGKQAEFLMHGAIPWDLISKIGVISLDLKTRVDGVLQSTGHRPTVKIQRDWYY